MSDQNKDEQVPEWKLTKEDMGIAPLSSNEIFGQGGTDFSKALTQAFEDMQKANPDTPKHVVIVTDGYPGQTIESFTTTTYNEEQKKQALKDMPETEFKEVDAKVQPEEKNLDWKEALRKHFQTVELSQDSNILDISLTGIPKVENEPVSKLDNIVVYSMEPYSAAVTSEENKEAIVKGLSERIKSVNASLSSDIDNNNKPKLK